MPPSQRLPTTISCLQFQFTCSKWIRHTKSNIWLQDTLLILSSVHHSLLINHKIFDIYLTTKAFRAIAPSSVVFQKWLEHLDWTKVKRKKRKVKVETRLPPLSLFSSKHTKVTTMEKNNFWILQLLFPPASAPPLPPSPSNTEAWWPPHLTQRSRGRVGNQEVLSQLTRIYYDLVSQCSMGFLSRGMFVRQGEIQVTQRNQREGGQIGLKDNITNTRTMFVTKRLRDQVQVSKVFQKAPFCSQLFKSSKTKLLTFSNMHSLS